MKKTIKLIIFFLALLLALPAAAQEWKLAGKTRNDNFLMYYDSSSLKHIDKDAVSIDVKEELSEKGFGHFSENFYKSLKEAEEKAGTKVENPESLLKLLARYEAKQYLVRIDCRKNEYTIPPAKGSSVNVIMVYDIEPGSAWEKIKNDVCPDTAR